MSEHATRFIQHLKRLEQDQDRGALAALRHSLAFAPGAYPKAYPHVERFVGSDWHARDARRLALYAVAGLFARHPLQHGQSFASAFGELWRKRESPSIEQRFVALLGADAENVLRYLRQAVTLLAADEIGCDYGRLLNDLSSWMDPRSDHDRLRQHWARDFYRAAQAKPESEAANVQ